MKIQAGRINISVNNFHPKGWNNLSIIHNIHLQLITDNINKGV